MIPDWLDEEAWEGFKGMRKLIKKPMTPRAEKMAIRKLEGFREKGYNVTEILNKSEFNNWTDLYPPKEEKTYETHQRNTTSGRPTPVDRVLAAAEDRERKRQFEGSDDGQTVAENDGNIRPFVPGVWSKSQ